MFVPVDTGLFVSMERRDGSIRTVSHLPCCVVSLAEFDRSFGAS